MESRFVILVVDQQPFQPELHIRATLRNMRLEAEQVELVVQSNPNDAGALGGVVRATAQRRGFQADLTRTVCTPYTSSDGISGVAVSIPIPAGSMAPAAHAPAQRKPAPPARSTTPAPATSGRPKEKVSWLGRLFGHGSS